MYKCTLHSWARKRCNLPVFTKHFIITLRESLWSVTGSFLSLAQEENQTWEKWRTVAVHVSCGDKHKFSPHMADENKNPIWKKLCFHDNIHGLVFPTLILGEQGQYMSTFLHLHLTLSPMWKKSLKIYPPVVKKKEI